ncbi:hypothetical protein CYMTET_12135 [Cymbomonas tetramitiformis]|uniref:Uncharacterized protein n=1 Tax=Cymbomonas tetramitiformis TaxID=36881 RepID=A0AAE0LCD0_9CHLO|nr:hypothetical protein CYMTET_12135 [Cymbomonas tetramitiformis]
MCTRATETAICIPSADGMNAAPVTDARVVECPTALHSMGVPLKTERTTTARHIACNSATASASIAWALIRMDATLKDTVDANGLAPVLVAARNGSLSVDKTHVAVVMMNAGADPATRDPSEMNVTMTSVATCNTASCFTH